LAVTCCWTFTFTVSKVAGVGMSDSRMSSNPPACVVLPPQPTKTTNIAKIVTTRLETLEPRA
jgi:hypothetical protein